MLASNCECRDVSKGDSSKRFVGLAKDVGRQYFARAGCMRGEDQTNARTK